MAEPTKAGNRKWRIVKGVIISGWILTLLTMLGLISATVYLWLMGREPPAPLIQWGGLAIAFLFNWFTSVLGKFMEEEADV